MMFSVVSRRASVCLIAFGVTVWFVRPAAACSIAGPSPHVVDGAKAEMDHSPPTLSSVTVVQISRGTGGDGCAHSSCDGIGNSQIHAAVSDDMSPASELGYRLNLVGGTLPKGLWPALDVPFRLGAGNIGLHWDDGEPADQDTVDFTLQVVAIDAAGNESQPQTVRIYDPKGGCSVASRSTGHSLTAALLMLLVAGRRPRSPQSRRPAPP